MPLSDLTDPEAVLRAIEEFDKIGRTAFLEKYGFGRNSDYYVVWKESRYDAKAIAGAAYGNQHGAALKATDFRGGYRTVGVHFERLGFALEAPWELPDWTRDELLLALHLYLSTRGKTGFGKQTKAVIELSSELRALTIFPLGLRSNLRFRNPSGVALKIHNFESVDPSHHGRGMPHIAKADKAIWEEWAHRPDELAEVVAAIRDENARGGLENETGEPEEYVADEGRLLYRAHRQRERDRKIVAKKKQEVLKRTGRLMCEVCGFESKDIYGDEVDDVIDVHHVVPLHVAGESQTRLSDLALICPNCHRAVHRHQPFISPSALRDKLKLRQGSR